MGDTRSAWAAYGGSCAPGDTHSTWDLGRVHDEVVYVRPPQSTYRPLIGLSARKTMISFLPTEWSPSPPPPDSLAPVDFKQHGQNVHGACYGERPGGGGDETSKIPRTKHQRNVEISVYRTVGLSKSWWVGDTLTKIILNSQSVGSSNNCLSKCPKGPPYLAHVSAWFSLASMRHLRLLRMLARLCVTMPCSD